MCVFLQVVVEGVADRRSSGDIAVDNIQIIDGLSAEDCKGVYNLTHTKNNTVVLFKTVM